MGDLARAFPIERFDDEEKFECSRCHRMTDAIDGGCPDEFDLDGDFCSCCWCEVANVCV